MSTQRRALAELTGGDWGDLSFLWTSESPLLWLSLCAAAMLLFLFIGWAATWPKKQVKSPYSNEPMRTSSDLSYEVIGKMYLYFTALREYDNQMPPLSSLLICRQTGRVFPNARNFFGKPTLDWGFLNKRYPGNYVSWGSLTVSQKRAVFEAQGSLDGFQTEVSSPEAAPSAVSPEFALTKPGPLYVDLETFIVIGWKILPGTDIELLIVQKPRIRHHLGASNPNSLTVDT